MQSEHELSEIRKVSQNMECPFAKTNKSVIHVTHLNSNGVTSLIE